MQGRLAPIRATRHALWVHRLPTRLRRPVSAGCDEVSATPAKPVGAATAVKQVPSLVKFFPAARAWQATNSWPWLRFGIGRPPRPTAAGGGSYTRPARRHGSSCPTGAPNDPRQNGRPRRAGAVERGAAGVPLVDPRLSQRKLPMHLPTTAVWVPRLGWCRSDGIRPGRTGRPRGRPLRPVELAISAVHERRSGR